MQYNVNSLKETTDLAINMGKIFSERAKSGLAVPRAFYLYGDLGAGKTTFTRLFVSAFDGAKEAEVASPSFTICNEYPTNPEIFHADLYRLPENISLPEELSDMVALQNTAQNDTQKIAPLLILEWPERLLETKKEHDRLDIYIGTFATCACEECSNHGTLENSDTIKLDNCPSSCDKREMLLPFEASQDDMDCKNSGNETRLFTFMGYGENARAYLKVVREQFGF